MTSLEEFILARYFYRIGRPTMTDAEYDSLVAQMRSEPAAAEYLARTYDDDPIPYELLESIGCPCESIDIGSSLYDQMNEDKSFSIESATTPGEAISFFREKKAQGLDLMVSLKMDGNNTKMGYENGKFKIALSRGRRGNAFDFTRAVSMVVPETIETDQPFMRVFGESYVDESGLDILRENFADVGFKTSKSAAITLLRVSYPEWCYKYLRTRVFMAEGLERTLDDMFSNLERQGVSTPPHFLVKADEIDLDNFEEWVYERILNPMSEMSVGIPSDGVVIEVNDLMWQGEESNQYVNRQLALKFGPWAFNIYQGTVKSIIFEQQRVFMSVRVRIEDMKTADGCVAKYVNVFGPNVLISEGIKPGSKIYFERNSGAVNILVYGDRLRRWLKRHNREV